MQNYFELLGFPESYALDLADLQRAYVKLQQSAHPDRMVGKSEEERAKAALASIEANDAYETLQNPLTRAQHLLELNGIIVNADERDTHKASQALLMEMLELREEMERAASEAEIAKQAQDIKAGMKRTEARLVELFEAGDYDSAAQDVIRLRYLGKSLEEAMSLHYRIKSRA